MPGTTFSCISWTIATAPATSSRSCRGSTSTCAAPRPKARRRKLCNCTRAVDTHGPEGHSNAVGGDSQVLISELGIEPFRLHHLRSRRRCQKLDQRLGRLGLLRSAGDGCSENRVKL